jgi:hypothetical protein
VSFAAYERSFRLAGHGNPSRSRESSSKQSEYRIRIVSCIKEKSKSKSVEARASSEMPLLSRPSHLLQFAFARLVAGLQKDVFKRENPVAIGLAR